MAINPHASWPSQTTAGSSAYPYGGAQNISVPGDGTGTPWVAPLLNDIWGLLQKLLVEASITPSGDADTVLASDYFDALTALFDQSALATTGAPGIVQLSNSTSSTSDSLAATIGALNALRTLLGVTVAGTSSNWSVKVGVLKIQGSTGTMSSNTSNTFTFSGVQTAYTGGHLASFAYNTDNTTTNLDPMQSAVVSSSQYRVTNANDGTAPYGHISIGYDVP